MLNRINAIAYLLLNYIRTVIDIPTLQVRMRCRKYEGAKKMQQYTPRGDRQNLGPDKNDTISWPEEQYVKFTLNCVPNQNVTI